MPSSTVSTLTTLFLSGSLPTRTNVVLLLQRARSLLRSEPTICKAETLHRKAFNVVGDLHGQYFDLQGGVFHNCGTPSVTNGFCFNGDFVDRGSWGVETILTLLAWKLEHPHDMYLTRGNHESRAMTSRYGFKSECVYKYDLAVYEMFLEVFNSLPLGVLLDHHTLIVHGGLCTDDVTISDLQQIDRFKEPPHNKGDRMMETLWSDPYNGKGIAPNKRGGNTILFGEDITARFCAKNNIERVIRSHQVVDLGVTTTHGGKLITVFSAPNYVDRGQNLGGVVVFEKDHMRFVQFKHSSHPDLPPMAYMKESTHAKRRRRRSRL